MPSCEAGTIDVQEPVHTPKQMPEFDRIDIGTGEEICPANGKTPTPKSPELHFYAAGSRLLSWRRTITADIDLFPFPTWDLIDADFCSELDHVTTFGALTRSSQIFAGQFDSGGRIVGTST
jgi:hypothetical protein